MHACETLNRAPKSPLSQWKFPFGVYMSVQAVPIECWQMFSLIV